MDYSKIDISKFNVLSVEEEKFLTEKYFETKDSESREKLINHNIKLVKYVAKDYQLYGYGNADLIAEGIVGLIKGVDKFDPTKGMKLSTYICNWIKAYILEFIVKNARMVRIGTTHNQRKVFWNLKKEQANLAAQGLEITADIIAEKLNVKESEVVEVASRMSDWSTDYVDPSAKGSSYLDSIASDEMTPDEAVSNVDYANHLANSMQKFKQTLKPKEKIIFQSRMLEDKTLQEVGDSLDLTRERIRQIENGLIEKLKRYCLNHNISV